MKAKRGVVIGLAMFVVGVIGWQFTKGRLYRQSQSVSSPVTSPVLPPPVTATVLQNREAERRLGPFTIAGQNYFIALREKKRFPGSTDETGDTVVAMEVRDSGGVVQY